jgi:DNA-binding transcriptional MerR regulator
VSEARAYCSRVNASVPRIAQAFTHPQWRWIASDGQRHRDRQSRPSLPLAFRLARLFERPIEDIFDDRPEARPPGTNRGLTLTLREGLGFAAMDELRTLTVGAVARMSGVTVRTLHHYDEVGLLRASRRSDAGYRRYDDADLDRLQRILFYRELGFGLDDIRTVMTDGDADAIGHLRRQHAMLLDRIGRLKRMVIAVEKAMEAHTMGISLTPEERLEVFGDFDPDAHAAEAEERWGGTEMYRQSQRRVARYTKADWQQLKAEATEYGERLVSAMRAGKPADSVEAMDAAEAHRQHISRWFYDCTYEIHRGLGQLYVDDPRFTATYEKAAPGLAAYLRDAIVANADRAER